MTTVTILHPDGVVNAVLDRAEMLRDMTPGQREYWRHELDGNEPS
jgi:hypothetical protein